MGQYYKPIIIDDNHAPIMWANSHDFDNGLKLMEHSWIGNNFVGLIERLLFRNPQRLVWAGDYADAEKDYEGQDLVTLTDENNDRPYDINLYGTVTEERYREENDRKLWPEFALKKYEANPIEIKPHMIKKVPKNWYYVINHDTKEYIDKRDIPVTDTWVNPKNPKDTFNYVIHPLPLMTCEGNNRGGGDYRPHDPETECEKLIGTWSRALISIDSRKPKGYTKVKFDLKE